MSELKTYECTVLFDASSNTTVKAATPEEAAILAEESCSGNQHLCHQCSETMDTGDAYGVHVYEGETLVADTTPDAVAIKNLKAQSHTMLAALKAAEPVLADIDRHLRAKHPGMQTLEALTTVRAAIAAAPVAHHGLEATGVATQKQTNLSDKERAARLLTTGELADVTAPWSHIWSDQSFGIANAAVAKFCDVNGIPIAATPSAPTEQRPQNCGTGFCSCIECPYHDQPRATSCECSK